MYVIMKFQLSTLVKVVLLLLATKYVTEMLWEINDGVDSQYSGLAE